MTCRRMREGLIEYLDGDTPARQRAVISEHLAACADCRAHAAALEKAETALRALAAIEAAPEMTADLRSRMAATARPRPTWGWAGAGIAAVALTVALAILLLRPPAAISPVRPIAVDVGASHHDVAQPPSAVNGRTPPAPLRVPLPKAVAEAPRAQAPPAVTEMPRAAKAGGVPHRLQRHHLVSRWHRAVKAPPERPQPEAAPIEEQPPEPAPVEVAEAPVGVVLLVGAPREMPPVSSYHVEVSFPDGAKSLLVQEVERDANGRPRTIQVACRETAPASATSIQGGVK